MQSLKSQIDIKLSCEISPFEPMDVYGIPKETTCA